MSDLRLVEVNKLCQSQPGITAAYKAGLILQENGWMRYPAACWDKPAILVFDARQCVAGLNYSFDEDELHADILFAFCAATHPLALAKALLKFRQIAKGKGSVEEVRFTCHPGNDAMMRAVEMFKLTPSSLSFRMPFVA